MLLDQLDKARYVRFDKVNKVIYAWYGSHGVNIYTPDGIEIDYYTMGGFENDTIKFYQVKASIDLRVDQ